LRERNLTLCQNGSKKLPGIKNPYLPFGGKMRTIYPSVLKAEVVNELHRLHKNCLLAPADKANNNIVFVCKGYYYNCLSNELGFTSASENPTYTRCNLTKYEILQNYLSV
jgi:hypothetical protein